MSSPATSRIVGYPLRYSETAAELWLWSRAPLTWHGKVTIEFRDVPFHDLCPARALKHWDVLAYWANKIACRRAIAPLIVNELRNGLFYVHDGNHRLEAMRICFRNRLGRLQVRVGVLRPKPGFQFEYRQFRTHWTYALRPDFICTRPSASEYTSASVQPTSCAPEVLHASA